jgi:Protein of unknown function (DUF4197)
MHKLLCTAETINLERRASLVQLAFYSALLALAVPGRNAWALSLADISQKDASIGLKTALEKGANVAVSLLGKTDGFWGNEAVRIPLPEWLIKAETALRFMGKGKDIDALKLGVNRAAEQAVPQAKTLLVGAVKSMSVDDAKGILTGGDNAVTQFFKGKTEKPIGDKFLPIVTKVTDRIGLAREYNRIAGQGLQMGLVKPEQARVERHVTTKALDGLYYMIGEEEKKIRQDPVGTGSAILQKVFGAIR